MTRWQVKRNSGIIKKRVCFVHGIPWCFPKRNAPCTPQLTATEIPSLPGAKPEEQINKSDADATSGLMHKVHSENSFKIYFGFWKQSLFICSVSTYRNNVCRMSKWKAITNVTVKVANKRVTVKTTRNNVKQASRGRYFSNKYDICLATSQQILKQMWNYYCKLNISFKYKAVPIRYRHWKSARYQ